MRPDLARGVTVPANLLLFGEYAVLENGGLGLGIAIEARARALHDRHEARLQIKGETPAGTVVWPGDHAVLGGAAAALEATLGPIGGDIRIDTSAFFRSDGQKRGFGSSAAVAVALTALWTAEATGARPSAEEIAAGAVRAHRAAQGGRGSGYDVWTSSLGGTVLFYGGTEPRAERIELPWLPRLMLVAGSRPVATTDAVARYRAWSDDNPRESAAYLERSNGLIEDIVAAPSWERARPLVRAYRELGATLGARIGVSAHLFTGAVSADDAVRISADAGSAADAPLVKAVGAGNELGVAFVGPGDETATLAGAEISEIAAAREGVAWE